MRQLRADVWLLELGFRVPLDARAYVIDERVDPGTGEHDGGGEVTLIDTGIRYNRRGRSLTGEMAAAGYEPGDIDRVLLTHYDLDHTGGLDRTAFDCPVYMGERDVALMRGEWDPPLFHHKGLFHRVARELFPLPDWVDLRPVGDGERIGRFTAYHTPGHNPGHTVYLHDSGVAFLGDLVWGGDRGLTTPFWADSYDMRELARSVRSLADRTDGFEMALMAHGDPSLEGGHERLRELADSV
jgi:glyoxylase-like metal-dependent hydrolase (beta-lactamase superfamily II)